MLTLGFPSGSYCGASVADAIPESWVPSPGVFW
jgi:hypothetical protein